MFEWMEGNIVPHVGKIHSPSELFWLMLSIITSIEEMIIETLIRGILFAFTRNGILPAIVAIACPIAAWHSAMGGDRSSSGR